MLGDNSFVLGWFDKVGDDRLLVINLGHQMELRSRGEPLIAPPSDMRWQTLCSSEQPRNWGDGVDRGGL